MNTKLILSTTLAAICAMLFASSTVLSQGNGNGNGNGGGGGNQGPDWRIIQLDTDDGSGSVLSGDAHDINASRLIAGWVMGADPTNVNSVQATCWTMTEVNGEPESQIHYLDQSPFLQSNAFGCNDLGEIAGSAWSGLTTHRAVYWPDKDSAVQPLPMPLAVSEAHEINSSGVICGWSGNGGSSGEARALVWTWTAGEWQFLELAPLGAPEQDETGNTLPNRSWTGDISDADPETGIMTVVGRSNGNAVAWTVFLDNSGNLVAGPATILDANAEATGINNTGTICGSGLLGPSSGGDGVVWVDGGAAQLLLPTYWKFSGNPQQVWPQGLNDGGLIVGYAFASAIVWLDKDAEPILLDDFLPKGKRATLKYLTRARAVNDSGDIVGRGSHGEDGPSPPFLAIRKQ